MEKEVNPGQSGRSSRVKDNGGISKGGSFTYDYANGRLFLFLVRGLLGIILLSNLTFQPSYAPFVTKPILSGVPQFNATAALAGTTDDFIRRVAIQNFILSPLAPYRVTWPDSDQTIDCNDDQCVAVRIHWNIEYTVVIPSIWNPSQPLPQYTDGWKTQFDADHPWTALKVNNASTVQMEFAYPTTSSIFNETDCRMYGYPYLAIQICLTSGDASNQMIAGIPSFILTKFSGRRLR